MKTLKTTDKRNILDKVDMEGLGYYVENYGSDFDGTEFETLVTRLKSDLHQLNKILERWQEELDPDY